ncbi:MAG: hypothetical protein ACNI3A_03255 [Desulfovibrio sp.]|uniref:hypothetical protein n=1 Tax=Desulfovibrio sp. 7SRBS1 TaxID=3378064 RepID=UPI003B3F492E
MGQMLNTYDSLTVEDQIKTLGDQELLDFWEETQQLERLLTENTGEQQASSLDYERLILTELQLRFCQRSISPF